ncbi:Nodulation protein nolO [hydrothermal vent metagenome]|uniref:Nodulation protein nolO n=1 Tax=hydrothermal vent metagenome TaxID=652676 RepID=A0A3B1C0B5_9ZZZZ
MDVLYHLLFQYRSFEAIYILGISAFYHDSAVALLKDGKIVSAAQEERFTRKKHDADFPHQAVDFCLSEAGITSKEIDRVVFYDKPWIKFERLLETYLTYAPIGIKSFFQAMPVWIKEKLWTRDLLMEKLDYEGKVLFPEHHESHAASAFFPSPFREAAILTTDGVGEWATTTIGVGRGNDIELLYEINFPHSLGLLYSAFTYYTGFKVNSGEYKVMGLAPYGEPKYVDLIYDNIIDLKEDGSFKLDMSYFNYCAGLTMTSEKFHNLFGAPPRTGETEITQREMDLARSVQDVTEEAILRMGRHIRKITGLSKLCLAGGVALNCVANGKLLREKIFDDIWIQPAAGDAGGALGAALFAWHKVEGKPREVDDKNDLQFGSLLGPVYDNEEISNYLEKAKIPHRKFENVDGLASEVAKHLAEEKVIGWFYGRMEFGPRALGARSIIGDARSPKMQSIMNLKIKFRESFRPFAPSILRDKVASYFEIDSDSPYMLLVAPVKEDRRVAMTNDQRKLFGIEKLNVARSDVPAITHVDYSARVQTVDEKRNPAYYKLIQKFEELTGSPVIINTSFNVRGEPIVCRPEEAYKCFMRTEMDYLVLGDYLLDKKEQVKLEGDTDWREEFELD